MKIFKHKKIIIPIVIAGALISTSAILGLGGYFGGGDVIPEDTMTRGLVAAYNFDEGSGQTAYNAASTGAVNNGTLGSTATADTADPKWINRSQASNSPGSLTSDSSGALEFDGKNDYVNCGNDPSFDITDAITIEAWVKITTTGWMPFIWKSDTASLRHINYGINKDVNEKIQVGFGDGTEYRSKISTDILSTGWHHVVGVIVSATDMRIYVDSVEKAGNYYGDATTITANSNDLYIGKTLTYFFKGSIDSVRIYNRALSAEEVQYHYNRGGPVAHWKMDEGSGTTLLNSGSAATSNRASGTIYGATGAADVESAAATLVDATKAWITNEWAGETVEITSGTGNGQTRTVSSNTATVITVSAVWANNPDATSKYRITSDNEWTMGNPSASSGSGLCFDGVDDYVDIGDTTETSVKTISFWLKADDITSRDVIDLNGADYIEIDGSSNITATGFTGVVYIDAVPASTIDTNWHHITITTSSGQNASDLDIGVRDGSTYFDGILDDVRIYNYVRSADEIRLDYNAGFAVRFSGSLTSGGCSADPASCMDYGLAASYNMDEGSGTTLYDQSDNANDGILTNGPKWTTGHAVSRGRHGVSSGSALYFDGVNDYVNCGNDPSLNITDAITIEAWVKPIALPSSGEGLASKTDLKYGLTYFTDGKVYFYIGGGPYWSSIPISIDVWTHVVGTYDGTARRLYLNGIVEVENGDVGRDISGSADFKIGYCSGYFNGSIDSVRIYNRALSAEEIRYHYNKGNPVVHWSFDEGSGTTIHDAIGNADAQFPSNEDHQPTWSRP